VRRRVVLSSGCALALPSRAFAQPAPAGRGPQTLGLLTDYPLPAADLQAMRDNLARLGWLDGANLRFVHRASERRSKQVAAAVADLLDARPDVVVVAHDALAAAVQHRDDRVPIVIVSDPVGIGLAASLQRPGGRVTGLVTMSSDIRPKLFETARQLAPTARRIAGMFPLTGPVTPQVEAVPERGRQLARQVDAEYVPVPVRDVGQIEALVASLQPVSDHVLLVNLDSILFPNFQRIAAAARAAKLASGSQGLAYARQGGLMSYGIDLDAYRERALALTDKVLRGAPPGDIPIEQPMLIKLVLNRATARAIGLTIPQPLLLRADEVIE
jgi:putative tryptophan/tyrosine transport system substrate-binding protein